MVFSSLIFLYLFLPACLIAYFCMPKMAAKNVVLVLDTETTEPAPIRGCEERNLEVHKQTENKNNEW